MMCARPEVVALGVLADQICSRGEPHQILCFELNLLIRGTQIHEGVHPYLTRKGFPSTIECFCCHAVVI
jgi:hypothetical protein